MFMPFWKLILVYWMKKGMKKYVFAKILSMPFTLNMVKGISELGFWSFQYSHDPSWQAFAYNQIKDLMNLNTIENQ